MGKWIEPRTWVASEHVTYASFNTLRDQLDYLKDRERVHCYNTEDEELKDSKWEVLRWDSEQMDNNGMHSARQIDHSVKANAIASYFGNHLTASNRRSARVDINIGGYYLVILKVQFEASATGVRKIQLRKNSNESTSAGQSLGIWTEDATSAGQTVLFAKRLEKFSRDDHVNAFAWQSSGGFLDVISGNANTFLQVIQVSN